MPKVESRECPFHGQEVKPSLMAKGRCVALEDRSTQECCYQATRRFLQQGGAVEEVNDILRRIRGGGRVDILRRRGISNAASQKRI
jgi:hypothetical protein